MGYLKHFLQRDPFDCVKGYFSTAMKEREIVTVSSVSDFAIKEYLTKH